MNEDPKPGQSGQQPEPKPEPAKKPPAKPRTDTDSRRSIDPDQLNKRHQQGRD